MLILCQYGKNHIFKKGQSDRFSFHAAGLPVYSALYAQDRQDLCGVYGAFLCNYQLKGVSVYRLCFSSGYCFLFCPVPDIPPSFVASP